MKWFDGIEPPPERGTFGRQFRRQDDRRVDLARLADGRTLGWFRRKARVARVLIQSGDD